MFLSDTIFAPATAAGRGGVAIVRISGPSAKEAIIHLARIQEPEPRLATLSKFFHPKTGEALDCGIILWFPAPRSFTGEDVVELHTHGGAAVTKAIVKALMELPGYRLAEPGEFSRRAFEEGKLDLTEAEAIADLVNAETEAQRRQAYRQMEGTLGLLYDNWRSRLLRTLSHMEAAIDFVDDDLPEGLLEKQTKILLELADEISNHLNDGYRGERLRDGLSVAILGAPNAGKSSLLNALVRREAAIVSSIAGTTRDVIEVHLDLGGYPVTLADTAGLRESQDVIESEGIRRALERASRADLKILVLDGTTFPVIDPATQSVCDADTLCVLNKIDQLDSACSPAMVDINGHSFFLNKLSAQGGAGVSEFVERLTSEVERRMGGEAGPPLTRLRHRQALEEAVKHLKRAHLAEAAELRAEDVRLAARALGQITGRVDVEDVLDLIFQDFCIGK